MTLSLFLYTAIGIAIGIAGLYFHRREEKGRDE